MSHFEPVQPESTPAVTVKCAACCDANASASASQSHTHSEGRPSSLRENPFFLPLLVIALYSLVELLGGMWTHSLALLGDAWHMLADVSALALALWASLHHAQPQVSQRRQRTVAIINALAMLAVTLWMIFEAWSRVQQPRPVAATPMTVIATIGLLVNVWVAKYMHAGHTHASHTHATQPPHSSAEIQPDTHDHAGAHDHTDAHSHSHSLNHRAAFLHVLGDLLGSVVAVVAGLVIYYTGDTRIDPILSFVISAVLLAMVLHLIRDLWRSRKSSHAQPNPPHPHDDHRHTHVHHKQPHPHKH